MKLNEEDFDKLIDITGEIVSAEFYINYFYLGQQAGAIKDKIINLREFLTTKLLEDYSFLDKDMKEALIDYYVYADIYDKYSDGETRNKLDNLCSPRNPNYRSYMQLIDKISEINYGY